MASTPERRAERGDAAAAAAVQRVADRTSTGRIVVLPSGAAR
ncbi:hypothetical protein ABT115_28595 [Streptomyces sp. NPDC001832]